MNFEFNVPLWVTENRPDAQKSAQFGTCITLCCFGASAPCAKMGSLYDGPSEGPRRGAYRTRLAHEFLRRTLQMKKLLGLSVLLVFASLPAMAQGTPALEVGAGYTFRSFAPPPTGAPPAPPRVSMNGWNATVSYNVNDWFAVATDFDGTRNSVTDPLGGSDTTNIYTVLVGPRIYPVGHHKLSPFAHVLFGLAHLNINLPTSSGCSPFCTSTDGSFAFAAGGGLDMNLSRHFAVRLGEFDYERTSFLFIATPGLSDANSNYKFKAALLIRFGEK